MMIFCHTSGTRSSYLWDALSEIKSGGEFAAIDHCPGEFKPEIHVQGVGDIQLPLSEEQARKIIEQAHQAPYGKGSETLVDVSVRRTFEIDPGSFEIRNPDVWNRWVKHFTERLTRKRGVAGHPVQAELYKMLIYEEGAMFKAHTE